MQGAGAVAESLHTDPQAQDGEADTGKGRMEWHSHTSSRRATAPNTSQTVPSTAGRAFKCVNL